MLRLLLLAPLIAASLSGCAVLVGSVKPTEERAATETYHRLHLEERPGWKHLDQSDGESPKSPTNTSSSDAPDERVSDDPEGIADVAYQRADDGAIISLSSSCRTDKPLASPGGEARQLREFSDLLLLGVTGMKLREESFLDLPAGRALQTTVRGEIDGRLTMLRTVVLRRAACVFDLMLVAKPSAFARHESVFDEFTRAFRPRTP